MSDILAAFEKLSESINLNKQIIDDHIQLLSILAFSKNQDSKKIRNTYSMTKLFSDEMGIFDSN